MLRGLLWAHRVAFFGVIGVNAVEYVGVLGLAANCRPAIGHSRGSASLLGTLMDVCKSGEIDTECWPTPGDRSVRSSGMNIA